MSDQQPLFQESDAAERELAPEQLPGAQASQDQAADTVPVVPVRTDLSQNQLIPLPAATEADEEE
jgi:hypothetical protein